MWTRIHCGAGGGDDLDPEFEPEIEVSDGEGSGLEFDTEELGVR